MAQQNASFENDNVQVAVERDSGCKVILNITTKPLATKASHVAAVKTISKEVNIPGFRKGKAPESLVLQKYQPQVEKEFKDVLIRNSINEAVQLTSIRPFSSQASVSLKKCEPIAEGSYLISIEFEAFPEVPKVETENLSLKEIPSDKVTDKEIEKRIEELQLYHAEWEEITDRAASNEDFVVLDIDVIDEPPLAIHRDSRFHLKEGRMPNWARSIVEGLKTGESREGFSEPENAEDPEKFIPRKCKITVKKIQKAKLPPVDDALSKKAGVGTAAELRGQITKSLEKQAEDKARQTMRQAMKKLLVTKYPFELPKERMDSLHEECHQLAEEEGTQFANAEQRHAYAHQLLEEAEQTVRLSYLLPKVFKDHNLAFPTPREIQQRATEHMVMRYMAGQKDMGQEEIEHFSRIAESELITEKALDFLIEKAKKD